ncbi:D(2) dopamine receptor-like [Actinia tenebrosa]|uniref:D(2) dopamine receptor-like n=1 Tax=Actinia tenebrosa TaxID=6105 RepID=A0A6P8IWU1_ACTTE|nr:D(2) dopamine receptor-like [Actinia tenebrosa]XP_031571546.1 D(2) dopamine receptor-like [Actinia tenebrosa]XP_031571547.1 D(2) dopamine receptor-like [Actinia tenebrosa]
MNNSTQTNHTTPDSSAQTINSTTLSALPVLAWSAAYGTVAVMAVFGNSMVITAFARNAGLHTRTNFFVVGLATADLLIGMFAVPLFISLFWHYTRNASIPEGLAKVFDAVDIFSSFASIFQLMLISLERCYAILYPVSHRNSSKLVYVLVLVSFWLFSGILAMTQAFGKTNLGLKKAFFTLMWICYVVSFLVICVAYMGIWRKAKRRGGYGFQRKKRRQDREVMIAITVLIVIVVFIVTWLPFFTMNVLFFYDPAKGKGVPYEVVQFSKLLHYSNSAINPIIYSLKIPGFKKTFTSLLRRESRSNGRSRTFSLTRRDSTRNSTRKPSTPV